MRRWSGFKAIVAACAVLAASALSAQEADPAARWKDLNADLIAAFDAGEYDRGVRLAEEALALSQEAFGECHPDTLISLNYLAALYWAQGRYGEAEPLYARALELFRETLGALSGCCVNPGVKLVSFWSAPLGLDQSGVSF